MVRGNSVYFQKLERYRPLTFFHKPDRSDAQSELLHTSCIKSDLHDVATPAQDCPKPETSVLDATIRIHSIFDVFEPVLVCIISFYFLAERIILWHLRHSSLTF